MRIRDRSDTAPAQRGRNWLLIKHADFWSGPIDIGEFAPRSVVSDGDFDDILAADMPELWVTGRPATASGRGSAARLTQQVIESAARKILARREEAQPEAVPGKRRPGARARRPRKP